MYNFSRLPVKTRPQVNYGAVGGVYSYFDSSPRRKRRAENLQGASKSCTNFWRSTDGQLDQVLVILFETAYCSYQSIKTSINKICIGRYWGYIVINYRHSKASCNFQRSSSRSVRCLRFMSPSTISRASAVKDMQLWFEPVNSGPVAAIQRFLELTKMVIS